MRVVHPHPQKPIRRTPDFTAWIRKVELSEVRSVALLRMWG